MKKFEIIFDYVDDVVTEKGIIGRILRNDWMFVEADNITDARFSFHKYCTGIIKSIKEVKR